MQDNDNTNFVHAIGGGLVHLVLVRAADARAVIGTNGAGVPDDDSDPAFLPIHSFGENAVIDTGVAAQTRLITIALENVMGPGGGGTYSLSLLDGGANRGHVTRPISGTPGFSIGLSTLSVTLGTEPGSRSTFDVSVTVDGRPAPLGLARAGIDALGREATEFLWWVVARSDTGRTLRMPFFYRASPTAAVFSAAPFQNAIQDDTTPVQADGVDREGNYRLSWTYPGPPAEAPCGFQIEESAAPLTTLFSDDGSELLLAGSNSKWRGAAEWNSAIHPEKLTAGYAVVYHDRLDGALAMTSAVALPADTKIDLSFDTYQDLADGFDFGFVDVSVDGSAYLTLARYTGAFTGTRTLDLSRFAGRSVAIRFRVVGDLLSTPAYLGWFLDHIAIRAASWTVIGTTDAATFVYDVSSRPTGNYLYRITCLYGAFCISAGAYSNIRSISVQRDVEPPRQEPIGRFAASPNRATQTRTSEPTRSAR